MEPNTALEELIIQQYPYMGVNRQGLFAGRAAFKARLITAFPAYNEIQFKQAVNNLMKMGRLPTKEKIVPTAQQQQQQQPDVRAETLEEWVRAVYPRCSRGADGALWSLKKIRKTIIAKVPAHLKESATTLGIIDTTLWDIFSKEEREGQRVEAKPEPEPEIEFHAHPNPTNGALPQSMIAWVRSVYPIHGVTPRGARLRERELIVKLLPLVPLHLHSKMEELGGAVQTVRNEDTAAASVNGGNVDMPSDFNAQTTTTISSDPKINEIPRAPATQPRAPAFSNWEATPPATDDDGWNAGPSDGTNGWDSAPAQVPDGWGSVPAQGWDSVPAKVPAGWDSVPAQGTDGWGSAPAQVPDGWDSAPAKAPDGWVSTPGQTTEHSERNMPAPAHDRRNMPAPAHDRRNMPAPAHDRRDMPAPAHDRRDMPAPAHDRRNMPAPAHDRRDMSAPAHDRRDMPAPAHDRRDMSAPTHDRRDMPAPAHNRRDMPVPAHNRRDMPAPGAAHRNRARKPPTQYAAPQDVAPEANVPEKPVHRNAKVAAALDVHVEEEEVGEPQPAPTLDDQMCLLDIAIPGEDGELVDIPATDIKNSVLFTADLIEKHKKLLPQYGLLGQAFSNGTQSIADPRLFLNTNHPFSVFCCGLQGAGKSHSLSCLIENCLLPTRTLGILKRPLSAMVFHFSQYTSRLNFRPCEAAFIACPDPKFKDQHRTVPVTVLVSPSNFAGLQIAYSEIPGVTVKPLLLRPQDLNIGSMLTLMSVNQASSPPLYISHVTKILREMAAHSDGFNFPEFKRLLYEVDMMPLQRKPLEQRIELLESFLDMQGNNDGFGFPEGSITIVDLSCPFVDENTACVLFNICLGVFLQDSTPGVGKVIAVDEAHKYITDTPASKVLTESLLQLVRQQRHYGARIIISTQEPTIDPRLMDLCSLTLIHRFTSPEWFKTLCRHVSVMEDDDAKLFQRIINLRVGEGLIFCPSAIVPSAFLEGSLSVDGDLVGTGDGDGCSGASANQNEKLGGRFLRIKVRRRLTADGGKSIVSV